MEHCLASGDAVPGQGAEVSQGEKEKRGDSHMGQMLVRCGEKERKREGEITLRRRCNIHALNSSSQILCRDQAESEAVCQVHATV